MTSASLEAAKAQAAQLAEAFHAGLSQFQKPAYNETQVRVDFINHFFCLLGWDVDNRQGLPQYLREVTHEATVVVEENGAPRSKKPDYSFNAGTETLFFLEAKKPSVDITVDTGPAFQLRRYGWSGNLRISVLTNFTDLYIYDCTIRPTETDDVGTALIAHYHYTEYAAKFEEIYQYLSKDSVLNGEFQRQFGDIRGALRREPFDAYFLQQIRSWRALLGEDVFRQNPAADMETLNLFVQRMLNRIIFLRICEDRGFEEYGALLAARTYDQLNALFAAADGKYGSGLFAPLEEDRLTVSDSAIASILQDLYYPNSPYEFSVIDPHIIGQIYELYLAETLALDDGGGLVVIAKPEVVDVQGAVTTPKNITDIIVEETLTPLYAGKTPEETAGYRVADICCGSGVFLLSAFEFIQRFLTEYYALHDREGALRRGDLLQRPGRGLALSYRRKRRILEDSLFGTDIDPLAVEVSKFSLLLKVLEDSSPEEAEACRAREKLLPNLDRNIKTGNSLVDMSYARFDPSLCRSLPLLSKLKPFDWEEEFGFRGFDAIIGNPPYIRVQNMVHYSREEYEFYKSPHSPYETAQAETLDKYYLFIEKGLELLTPQGQLGYIVPHKFMTIKSGAPLRRLLGQRAALRKLLHFGTYQVFAARSTYTCILLLSKAPNETLSMGFVRDWPCFLFQHEVRCETYPSASFGEGPWAFLPRRLAEHLRNLAPRCVPLSQLADIFVGVQTSADGIYILRAEAEDGEFVYSHDSLGRPFQAEKGILRKSVYDARLTAYEKIVANSYIIFPYHQAGKRPALYTPEEMARRFPCALEYLQRFRPQLDQRNMPSRTEETWYAFGRSQSLRRVVAGEHLVWPVLSVGPNYVYDDELVVFTGSGNGPFYGLAMKPAARESIFYIQAILNHSLMEMLVKSRTSVFRGDYYSHGKQFLVSLPIRKIDFDDPAQAEAHRQIVDAATALTQLRSQIQAAPNHTQRLLLERTAGETARRLNHCVDCLYGWSG